MDSEQMVKILGKAVYDHGCVWVMGHRNWPESVAQTEQVEPCSGIAVVEVSTPELGAWLATVLNGVLDGVTAMEPPPAGGLLQRGRFEARGTIVKASSWDKPHPTFGATGSAEADVAECQPALQATTLADVLNRVLDVASMPTR